MSPCGSNLKLLLLPVKILSASDSLHIKIQRACLRGKRLIQGRGGGMWGVANNRLGKGFINISSA